LAYDKFLQALKDIGQRQVAEALEGLELRGLVDPQFGDDTPPEQRSKIIKVVSSRMEEALVRGSEQTVNELSRIMQQNGFAVSSVREGSIHISFRCFTEESLVNLKRLYTDKTLDKLFTEAFCPEFAEQGLESLTIRINDEEFERCAETFKQTTPMDTDVPQVSSHVK